MGLITYPVVYLRRPATTHLDELTPPQGCLDTATTLHQEIVPFAASQEIGMSIKRVAALYVGLVALVGVVQFAIFPLYAHTILTGR